MNTTNLQTLKFPYTRFYKSYEHSCERQKTVILVLLDCIFFIDIRRVNIQTKLWYPHKTQEFHLHPLS